MAGENEAGENAEKAQRAERAKSRAFGRRPNSAPSSGKLARAAATSARSEAALRTAADLKPRGLSWGLVLCIAATVVLGLLALINRPQFDDGAAYYVAAGVVIQSWLILDRRGLWPRRRIMRGLLALAAVAAFAGIANAYWISAYWLTKSNDPNRFLFTTTQDAMLAFDNRWCRTWKGHVWTCGLKSTIPSPGSGSELTGITIAQNGRVICTSNGRLVPGFSEKNYVGTCRADVPSWCLEYWNGWRAVPNSREELSTGDPEIGAAVSDANRLRSLDLYPGKCIKTIWGF